MVCISCSLRKAALLVDTSSSLHDHPQVKKRKFYPQTAPSALSAASCTTPLPPQWRRRTANFLSNINALISVDTNRARKISHTQPAIPVVTVNSLATRIVMGEGKNTPKPLARTFIGIRINSNKTILYILGTQWVQFVRLTGNLIGFGIKSDYTIFVYFGNLWVQFELLLDKTLTCVPL